MARVTTPVDEQTLEFVMQHATDLGLREDSSQASVLGRVIELGVQDLKRRLRDEARDRLYAAWADDPERLEAVEFHQQAADQTGMY